MRRAKEFFDGNNLQSPYILHRYNLNVPRPHMEGDIGTYLNRRIENFDHRNPFVSSWYLDEILHIHKADRPGYENEFDIYNYYRNHNMTRAEYYFECQINQFYRIIFFFMELSARGISNDNKDMYEGPIPYNVIPEKIQAIIYDDDVYRDYLISEREMIEFLMPGTENVFMQNLVRTAQVYEEDLIMLRKNTPSTKGEQYRSTTPSYKISTSVQTSTTSKAYKRSNKGSVWMNQNGKHFGKRSKLTFADCTYESSKQIFNSENIKKLTETRNKVFDFCYLTNRRYHWTAESVNSTYYFGYILLQNGNLKQQILLGEELSDLLKKISQCIR